VEKSVPEHQTPLFAMIDVGLTPTFFPGRMAHRLYVSPPVDSSSRQLFGRPVTREDLTSVRAMSLPGAVVRGTAATLLDMTLVSALG
jgi:predicted Kef-type K+ transport protein